MEWFFFHISRLILVYIWLEVPLLKKNSITLVKDDKVYFI